MEKKKIKKPRGIVRYLGGKCVACGERCASACPVDGIAFNDAGDPVINEDKCIGCDKCVKICAVNALEMFYTPEQLEQLKLWEAQKNASDEEADPEEQALRAKLAGYKGVWVFIEQYLGDVAKVSWELLGTGRELADTRGVELTAVIIGHDIDRRRKALVLEPKARVDLALEVFAGQQIVLRMLLANLRIRPLPVRSLEKRGNPSDTALD